jgi:cell division protein FtsI (penicillin-binding protein 3)
MARERKASTGGQKAPAAGLFGRLRGRAPERDEERRRDGWRTTIRRRTIVALSLVTLWVGCVEARLVYLQVVRHDHYQQLATEQQESVVSVSAPRGDIVDRSGTLLAYTVDAKAIFADPSRVENPEETVAALCRALADCDQAERARLLAHLNSNSRFRYVRRSWQASPEQVRRVAALNLPGIGLQEDTGRFYPLGSLAAHVVGFVNQDNIGQAGLEYAYDERIRGEAGLLHVQYDARRRSYQTTVTREPVPGGRLELTIDARLQHIVERELAAGVTNARARAGTAVVMDPHTGEILALASYPTFDPNRYTTASPEARRNRAVQDVYEPGSTFKIVTASAAIEEGVVTPNELIDTRPGFIKFPGRKAITENNGHNYGVLTFTDSLVKSSNVAAIKVGLRMGVPILSRYVHRFGFGERIAPDFPGQSRGLWAPNRLDNSGLASVSMGYQVAVTPIQMAAAASVVANGGLLMEPRVVRAVERDGVREVVQPRVIRRVVEAETAQLVADMMEQVVSRGTARSARIEGYPAAGKTGTAHKVAENGRGYSRSDYNASFVGFVPANDPQITILVVIDTPRTSIYGGTVAAPVFRAIAEGALQYLGTAPDASQSPTVTVRAGAGDLSPLRRVSTSAVEPVLIRTGGAAVMPDLRGLSAREALRIVAAAGMSAQISGTGFVARQHPEAGEPIEPGGTSLLVLARDPSLREEATP